MCAPCTLRSPLKNNLKILEARRLITSIPHATWKQPHAPQVWDSVLFQDTQYRLKQPKNLEARRLEARRLEARRLEARGLEDRGWSCCCSMVVRGAVAAPPEEWTPILFASGDTRQVYRTLR